MSDEEPGSETDTAFINATDEEAVTTDDINPVEANNSLESINDNEEKTCEDSNEKINDKINDESDNITGGTDGDRITTTAGSDDGNKEKVADKVEKFILEYFNSSDEESSGESSDEEEEEDSINESSSVVENIASKETNNSVNDTRDESNSSKEGGSSPENIDNSDESDLIEKVDEEKDSEDKDEEKEDQEEEQDEEKDSEKDDDEEKGDEEKEENQNEEQEKNDEETGGQQSEDESGGENSDEDRPRRPDLVYDFDIMMAKKKEQNYRKRKRNIDIISDCDDIIAEMVVQMRQAADDDIEMNKSHQAAVRKLKLLPIVETQLRKIDLRETFLDAGVLGVITDWLTPLPDRSLPNLKVREMMLKILSEFNICDVERLKSSGIGKAVMYLFKHPKETKDNKKRAAALISQWSKPIFNVESDYGSLTKEDREQRDFERANETKRMRYSDATDSSTPGTSKKGDERPLRPGEKGWVPRARVPQPSNKDYVIRPKSSVDLDTSRSGGKKQVSRLEKHIRNFREKKKQLKTQRAVKISIEGNKLN